MPLPAFTRWATAHSPASRLPVARGGHPFRHMFLPRPPRTDPSCDSVCPFPASVLACCCSGVAHKKSMWKPYVSPTVLSPKLLRPRRSQRGPTEAREGPGEALEKHRRGAGDRTRLREPPPEVELGQVPIWNPNGPAFVPSPEQIMLRCGAWAMHRRFIPPCAGRSCSSSSMCALRPIGVRAASCERNRTSVGGPGCASSGWGLPSVCF